MSPAGKLFLKFLVAITFIACMGPFTFLKDPDGRPLMTFAELKLGDFSRVSKFFSDFGNNVSQAFADLTGEAGPEENPVVSTDNMDKLHTWVDGTGMRHFSYEKPEGVNSEMIYVASGNGMEHYEKERERITSEGQKVLDGIAARKAAETAEAEAETGNSDPLENPMLEDGKIPDKISPGNLSQTVETLQYIQQNANRNQRTLEEEL